MKNKLEIFYVLLLLISCIFVVNPTIVSYAEEIEENLEISTLYPDNVQALLYKAQALNEMGNKKDALELYKKVLNLDPANSTAKSEIVGVMQATMTPSEYIAYLSQKANGDRTIQAMLYDYAVKLHKDNKTSDAIKAYEAYLLSNNSNVDAYVNLAICYASQNDYKKAQSTLNIAKNKFPTNNLVLKTLKDVQNDSISSTLAEIK